VTIAFSTVFEV